MGKTVDNRGITSFTPDDDEKTMYLDTGVFAFERYDLNKILELCKEKWPGVSDLSRIGIQAIYIHTDCLGYDRYDSGDYTNYLKIVLMD
jgi:hypothetical protein